MGGTTKRLRSTKFTGNALIYSHKMAAGQEVAAEWVWSIDQVDSICGKGLTIRKV